MIQIIAGHWRGRRIKTISGEGYRPATGKFREALFSVLDARGIRWENTRVLDVFAGSGSLGWEALSRGALQVWFMESDAHAVRLLRDHRAGFALPGQDVRVMAGDALRMLSRPAPQDFDLLFLDPPYGRDLILPAMRQAETRCWIAPQAMVVAEVEADWDWRLMNLPGFEVAANRLYGQTRMMIWKKT